MLRASSALFCLAGWYAGPVSSYAQSAANPQRLLAMGLNALGRPSGRP